MTNISVADIPLPDPEPRGMAGFQLSLAKMSFRGPLPGAATARLDVYRMYSSLISHGRAVNLVLATHWALASNDGAKPSSNQAIMASHWLSAIHQHGLLGHAMRPWLPHDEAMLIQAAETSGELQRGLDNACMSLLASKAMKSALITALAYPLVLLVATFVVIYTIGTQLLPQFAGILPPEAWTGSAVVLKYISYFAEHLLIPVVLAILLIATAICFSLPRWTNRFRDMVDRLPPWSLYRHWTGTTFLLSMAALIGAGVAQHDALAKLIATAPPYLQHHISRLLAKMHEGASNFGEAMYRTGTEWPDRRVVVYMRALGDAPDFDQLMTQLAKEWLNDGVAGIQTKAAVLRNIMFIVLFSLVGEVAAGIFALQQQMSAAVH